MFGMSVTWWWSSEWISKVVLETLVRTPDSGVSWSVRTGVLSCWAIGEVKVVIEMVVDE